MGYYKICPDCGAYLDPGESCDCREEEHIAGREEREDNVYDSNSKH